MATTYTKDRSFKFKVKEDVDGSLETVRVYEVFPMGARSTSVEGVKVLKKILPALGALQDAQGDSTSEFLGMNNPWTSAFFALEENLSEDHLEDLLEKLLGKVKFEGEFIQDIDAHFDEYPQDYLDLIMFAGEKTFYDFFMKSNGVRTKILPLIEKLNLKEKLSNVMKGQETD